MFFANLSSCLLLIRLQFAPITPWIQVKGGGLSFKVEFKCRGLCNIHPTCTKYVLCVGVSTSDVPPEVSDACAG